MRKFTIFLACALLFRLFWIISASAIAANPPAKVATSFSGTAKASTLIAQANGAELQASSLIIPKQEGIQFDVNDISFLWPAPNNVEAVNALISADEKTADGKSQIWPKAAFEAVIKTARESEAASVKDASGNPSKINFNDGPLANTFDQQNTWKVVGMRIDPSAPGSSTKMINTFGSVPQIRLIVQPVTINRLGLVIVHDYTAHLVYSFTKGPSRPAVPDREKFSEIVRDLKQLKKSLAANGVSTAGEPLGVHPGFRAALPSFRNELTAFVKKHLSAENLLGVSFMGIEPPEPWIFFAMTKQNGEFTLVNAPTLDENKAQMLSFLGGDAVVPVPKTKNLDSNSGVSTAMLFERDADSKLASKVFADKARPRFREIPDLIANPERSHFFNTDCVSCHSESARRQNLGIATGDALFKYQLPEGISGVDAALLPQSIWNVRNFGWFPNRSGALETVTMRTANETAEAVEFINQEYLTNTPVANVVAKSNNGGSAHLRRQPSQLSELSENDVCALKPGQSVGINAADSVVNGFTKVNVVIPNSACPSFTGEMFLFGKHFESAPITRVVAKKNGTAGASLRRRPLQLSKLTQGESCLLEPNRSIGVNAVQSVKDGFSKVNVIVPSPTCPSFKGSVFVFTKHFNFD